MIAPKFLLNRDRLVAFLGRYGGQDESVVERKTMADALALASALAGLMQEEGSSLQNTNGRGR